MEREVFFALWRQKVAWMNPHKKYTIYIVEGKEESGKERFIVRRRAKTATFLGPIDTNRYLKTFSLTLVAQFFHID